MSAIFDCAQSYPYHVRPQEGDDLVCKCQDYLVISKTPYGHRAACRGCGIRWTLLISETHWVEEKDHYADGPMLR